MPAGPLAMFRSLASRWDLTVDLARRELIGRYKGSVLGILWSLVQPLFLLAIYTTVFGYFLRIQGPGRPVHEFAVFLFTGMITWNLMSEVIGGASDLIVNRPAFVKRVVFPLEILALVQVLVALAQFFFALAVLLLAIAMFQDVHATTLLVPFMLVPLVALCMGGSWILSSLGVFLRDLPQTVSIVLMAGMFMTPIFYSVEQVPEAVQPVLLANPLTYFVSNMRIILLHGQVPNLLPLMLVYILSVLFAWGAYRFFQRTRPAFGDVL